MLLVEEEADADDHNRDATNEHQRGAARPHRNSANGDVTGNGISKLGGRRGRTRADQRTHPRCESGPAGRYLGGTVPFGWRLGEDGALIESPGQQAAIRRMVELRRSGLSLRAIADAMKAEGFELSHVGVKKVLKAAQGRQKAA